jgi:hypothetical protein
MTPTQRHRIERTIEALISILDVADGDPHLEDDEREDDPAERGIADYDGLIEQGFGNLWGDTVQ